MKVYELIQKLCVYDPDWEIIVRVDGDNERFTEYINDSISGQNTWSEVWATVDTVKTQNHSRKVFVDCDLQRL